MKMKKFMVTALACILAVTPFAVGCNKNVDSSQAGNAAGNSQAAPLPGEESSAKLGEAFTYKDLTITLEEIYEPEKAPSSRNSQFVAMKFTIKNDAGTTFYINALEDFNLFVDGTESFESLESSAAKIATVRGGTVVALDGAIDPNSSLTGVVTMELPNNWAKAKVVFTPDSRNSGDSVAYEIAVADVKAAE